ncbi:MAG: hypothetical protein ACO38S_09280 [Gemmobacter sp.]
MDPRRDSPERLAGYLAEFGGRAIGRRDGGAG